MRKLYILLCLSISLSLTAQTDTTGLQFDSALEGQFFYQQDKNNAFQHFYLIGADATAIASVENEQKQFQNFLVALEKKVRKKKPAKKAKAVFKKIHEAYFGKYVLNPVFQDIFTKKEYNCVTATALYSIAFEYLNIPYQIKQTPTHVYLLAYPKTARVVVETTLPGEESQKVKKETLKEYKKYLIKNKIISENEAAELTEENLINDYYLPDSNINIIQLIGIQYYNCGISYYEKEQLETSINQFEKAYRYFKYKYIKSLLLEVVLVQFEKHLGEDGSINAFAKTLAKILALNQELEFKDIKEFALQAFTSKSLPYLKKSDGSQALEELIQTTLQELNSDSLETLILQQGKLLLAEYHYHALNTQQSIDLYTKYYDEDLHTDLRLIIKDCLARHLDALSNAKNGLDTLAKYYVVFPFFKKDPNIRSFEVWCLMKLAHTHFELDEPEEGQKYLDQFTNTFQPNDPVKFIESAIGSGFGSASAYNVRKGKYKLANTFLEDGLKYAPDNLEMRRKKKYLAEFQD